MRTEFQQRWAQEDESASLTEKECRSKDEERKLHVQQGEDDDRKHLAEFKDIKGSDEDLASRICSALGIECSLARQEGPMGASAPVPVDSQQASASVRATNLVLGPGDVNACASAAHSGVVQRQTLLSVPGVSPDGGSAPPLAQTSTLSATAKPFVRLQPIATSSGFPFA